MEVVGYLVHTSYIGSCAYTHDPQAFIQKYGGYIITDDFAAKKEDPCAVLLVRENIVVLPDFTLSCIRPGSYEIRVKPCTDALLREMLRISLALAPGLDIQAVGERAYEFAALFTDRVVMVQTPPQLSGGDTVIVVGDPIYWVTIDVAPYPVSQF